MQFFCIKKQPISVNILSDIVKKYACNPDSLSDLRIVAMVLVAFAGFLRYKELSNLRYSDIVFQGDYMKLYLEQSNKDKYRKCIC